MVRHAYVKETLGVKQCPVADFSQVSWGRQLSPLNSLTGRSPLAPEMASWDPERGSRECPRLAGGHRACQDMWEQDRDKCERQQFRGQWASDQGAVQVRDEGYGLCSQATLGSDHSNIHLLSTPPLGRLHL